jgi:tetratricopeptide (TPR) repeat protein
MYKTSFRTIILSALLLAAVSAGAQTLWTVDFVSGKVEYQVKGTRMALSPGAKVADDATIYLGKGALVELSIGDRRISIVKEGMYTVKSISVTAFSSSRPGLLEALRSKLRGLTSGSPEVGVAGVRASEAAAPSFSTGGDEARKRGEAALQSGDYTAAARDFGYALEEALPGEEGPLRTDLASALAMLGRPAAALAVMRGGEQDEAPGRYILEATILLGAGAPDDALAVLRAVFPPLEGARAADGSTIEPHMLAEAAELEGLALEALVKPGEAAAAYRRAVNAAPGSPAAARAKQRLAAIGG